MNVKSLQVAYIQKSRLFLYPFLKISRKALIKPIEFYMCWEKHYNFTDNVLLLLYRLENSLKFQAFEQQILQKHPNFKEVYETIPDQTHEELYKLYVFDLSSFKVDYLKVVQGKYSQLTEDSKTLILNYYKVNNKDHPTMVSYLKPDKYYSNYAKLLGSPVKEEHLRKVGELCDPPDLKKEILQINVNTNTVNI